MAKKRQPKKNDFTGQSKPAKSKQGLTSFSEFLSGPKAKWLFFGVYLVITIFLFREFLFNDVMLYGSDTIPDGIYTRQYYKDYHAEFGGIPRWNPFILGGLPFIDAMHGDTFYPAAWLKFFMPLKRALGHKLVWHVFLAGVFMYIFLRTLKLRRDASFLGGLMYMLAPSFVSWLYGGHDAKMYVIAFLPLAFAFLEAGMSNPRFYKFVSLGAVMGLLILTSQVQMAYYAYWAIGLYFIFRLFYGTDGRSVRLKCITFFIMAVIIALSLGAVQLLPSYTFSTSQSVRAGEERTGYEYATSWSMHSEEAAGMIVPAFPGFSFSEGIKEKQGNYYWGKNPFKLNTEYHGILSMLLAIMALIICRERIKWFLLGLALLSFIYALGANTPVYRIFYAFVPGIKNFRAPGMIMFLFCFSVVVLASQFVSSLLDGKISLKKWNNKLLYAVGIIVVTAVVISIMGSNFFELWQNIFYRNINDVKLNSLAANVPLFTRDLWRVVILVSVNLAGLWMFTLKRMGGLALIILLAFSVFIDDSLIDSKFIMVLNPMRYNKSAPDRTVRELHKKISESNMPFRVLGILSQKHQTNYCAMFGIQIANGMHNNELQTYDLFKGGRSYKNYTSLWIDKNGFVPEGLSQNNFLKVAGVKYIIFPADGGETQLLENKEVLDRAFIVHDYVTVENDTLAVEMLQDISFDPARKVIINGETIISHDVFYTESVVERFDYTKNGIAIAASFEAPGFIVLTENWGPYWKAEIDGKHVGIQKAYGTFMAVECTEGKHEIQFVFRSSPFEKGKKLTLVTLLFVIVSLAVTGITKNIKRKKNAA